MLPAFLGHGSGKVFGGLGSSVLRYFFGAPVSESKPHQRLDILEHFMKRSMTLFGSLSGVLFWERCLELRIRYFMGFCGLSASVCFCQHEFALARISLHLSVLARMVCTVVCV